MLSLLAQAMTGCIFLSDFDEYRVGTDGGVGVDAADGSDAQTSDVVAPDGGELPIVNADDFRKRYLDLMCKKLMACGGKVPRADVSRVCSPAERYLGTRDGPFSNGAAFQFDMNAARTCLDDLEDWDCFYSEQIVPPSCTGVFEGSVQTNGLCESDAECDNGYCDANGRAPCPGLCGPRIPMNLPCQQSFQCELNLVCINNVCLPQAQEEEACTAERDVCENSLFCDFTMSPTVCKRRPGLGEECIVMQLGDFCELPYVCRPDPKTPGTSRCSAGGTMGADCNAIDVCAPGFQCTNMGTCVRAVLPGEECAASSECPPEFACHNDVCVPRPLPSEECEAPGFACLFSKCVEGVCTKLSDGANCEQQTGFLDPCQGYCNLTLNVCAAKGTAGTVCDNGEQCADDHACVTMTGQYQCAMCQ